MEGSTGMTNTSLGFGHIDKDRHLLSLLVDIIISGGVWDPNKPVNMPDLKDKIEIIYATLTALRNSSLGENAVPDLLDLCIPLFEEVRNIIRDLNGDEYDEEPQLRLTRDKDSNWFLLDKETSVLAPYSDLSEKSWTSKSFRSGMPRPIRQGSAARWYDASIEAGGRDLAKLPSVLLSLLSGGSARRIMLTGSPDWWAASISLALSDGRCPPALVLGIWIKPNHCAFIFRKIDRMQIPDKDEKAVTLTAVAQSHEVPRTRGSGVGWKQVKPMAIPAQDGGPEFQKFGRFPHPMINALDVRAVRKLSPARRSTSDRGERW
jgi:hypothetical protein